MKNLKEIKKIIMENKKTLIETYGIKEIGIFGSFSRNEQNEFSDIDILVSLKNDYKTFDNYMNLKEFLESILNIKVDLVTVDALKP
ncbi:MAG: nucleotidyltransferase, partial [Marinitoga sp. 4572_148]